MSFESLVVQGFWTTATQAADIASLVAFPLAVGGLVFALVQWRKTRGALEAAGRARKEARRDSALQQVLLVLGGLTEISQALSLAIITTNRTLAQRELGAWADLGGEAHGMLEGQSDATKELKDDLIKAITQASLANQRLANTDGEIVQVTAQARADIAKATAGVKRLIGRFRGYVADEEEREEEEDRG